VPRPPFRTSSMSTRTPSAPAERSDASRRLDAAALPKRFASVDELDDFLATPTQALIDDLVRAPGDILILGVAGKMGPTLARLAKNAAPERRVIGVARFSDKAVQARLDAAGVETIAADLLNRAEIDALPRVPNVIFAAGHKFGASGNPSMTWAMNTWVPALVAESFKESRIVAFSTGNVYPLTPATGPGSREGDALTPVGEYANSCVGRERVLEHVSRTHGTPMAIIRLNYAVDLRYGVLVDIAHRVVAREPVRVDMGWVNVIWQGDANAQAIRALTTAASPPVAINVTGPDRLSVREAAERLGELLGATPVFEGVEAPDALLSDTTFARSLFGRPTISTDVLIQWVASWVARGGTRLGKPTKFEVRDGRF